MIYRNDPSMKLADVQQKVWDYANNKYDKDRGALIAKKPPKNDAKSVTRAGFDPDADLGTSSSSTSKSSP
jgi:hypothetical protein